MQIMELYFYEDCEYSQIVIHTISKLKIQDKFTFKDIRLNPDYAKELEDLTGNITVPCLLKEEGFIIDYKVEENEKKMSPTAELFFAARHAGGTGAAGRGLLRSGAAGTGTAVAMSAIAASHHAPSPMPPTALGALLPSNAKGPPRPTPGSTCLHAMLPAHTHSLT